MGSEARDRLRLTAKGERTRARIVEAAAGLIYQRGVAGTSLDDIRSAADPDDLAATLLAALQGGLLLAQVQRDTRPLQTAVDTVLTLAGISRQDVPADGNPS